MTILLNATFASTRDGFDAGTQTAAAGPDEALGVLRVGASTTATYTLASALTSGVHRLTFWFYDWANSVIAANGSHFMFLMDDVSAISSANSIAAIQIARTESATATTLNCRNAASFVAATPQTLINHGFWWRVDVVVDFASKKYDVYLNGRLTFRQAAWPKTASANLKRIVILSQSAAPNCDFDNVVFESSWALVESTVLDLDFTSITGNLKTLAPDTDTINLYPQKANVGGDSTLSALLCGASGLYPQDRTKNAIAFWRGVMEGSTTATWTAAATGTIHMSVLMRSWEGWGTGKTTESNFYCLDYNGDRAAGTQLQLLKGTTVLAQSDGTAGGVSYSAGATYTLKLEFRGIYIFAYVNGQLQLTGPYKITSKHGNLSEEGCGVRFLANAGDNYCTGLVVSGPARSWAVSKTIGNLTAVIDNSYVSELYVSNGNLAESRTNLGFYKALQCNHSPSYEPSENDVNRHFTIYDTANVYVQRQSGLLNAENTYAGNASFYYTQTRRGIWIGNLVTLWLAGSLMPDHDLNPVPLLADGQYRVIEPTGASSLKDFMPVSDWNGKTTAYTVLPIGFQLRAGFTTGNPVRITAMFRNIQNCTNTYHVVEEKNADNGSPLGIATWRNAAAGGVAVGTVYEWGQLYLFEVANGLTLSDTVIVGVRDDVKTPATFTFVNGSLKADAVGDFDTDGFNERYGWYEVNAAGGKLNCTLVVGASITRYQPQLHINGYTGLTTISLAGVLATVNTDYVLDDLGDGTALLQILSNRAANTQIELTEPSSMGMARAPYWGRF